MHEHSGCSGRKEKETTLSYYCLKMHGMRLLGSLMQCSDSLVLTWKLCDRCHLNDRTLTRVVLSSDTPSFGVAVSSWLNVTQLVGNMASPNIAYCSSIVYEDSSCLSDKCKTTFEENKTKHLRDCWNLNVNSCKRRQLQQLHSSFRPVCVCGHAEMGSWRKVLTAVCRCGYLQVTFHEEMTQS